MATSLATAASAGPQGHHERPAAILRDRCRTFVSAPARRGNGLIVQDLVFLVDVDNTLLALPQPDRTVDSIAALRYLKKEELADGAVAIR